MTSISVKTPDYKSIVHCFRPKTEKLNFSKTGYNYIIGKGMSRGAECHKFELRAPSSEEFAQKNKQRTTYVHVQKTLYGWKPSALRYATH